MAISPAILSSTPPRRGRPPRPAVQAGPDGDVIPAYVPTPEPVAEAAPKLEQPTRRRKRADVNGQHLKLAAPSKEGHVRRWVNDTPGRVAMMQKLAYDFVEDSSIESDGTDSRVRRTVGSTAGGAPQYAYLMETPLEEYQYGVDEKEESRAAFEAAIRRGDDPLGSPLTAKTQTHESFIR